MPSCDAVDLTLPKQIESEQIILGSCLQFQEAVDFVYAKLDPIDFYDERNRITFRIIQKLASKEIPVNVKTAKDALQKEGELDKVGIGYLIGIPVGVPRLETLQHYVSEIRKASDQRKAITAANNFTTAAMSGNGDFEQEKERLQAVLLQINSDSGTEHHFEQGVDGRYKLNIPEVRVAIELDRLRRESNELIGELCVRCSLPGIPTYDGAVSIADFNLSSARARSERARLLETQSKSKEIGWHSHLEELCQRVLAAERNGQPAIDLRQLERPSSDDSILVEAINLPRRHPAILFGDGGAAKSYIGLYLAGCLVQRGMAVALFDWELSGEDHRDRLERLFGRMMPKILYARCERALVHEADRLRRIVRDEKIDYAIFDSVAFACDGPPESAEIAGRYFRAVRQIGGGSLHIAHITKSEGGDQKPFGSVFWHNGARSTYFVKLSDSSRDGKTLYIGLFNRKANLGGLHPPTGFTINFTEDRTYFAKSDPADTPDLAEKMTIRQRMTHKLRSGALPLEEIAREIDAELDTIHRTIRRHKKIFTLLEGGKVALLQQVS